MLDNALGQDKCECTVSHYGCGYQMFTYPECLLSVQIHCSSARCSEPLYSSWTCFAFI